MFNSYARIRSTDRPLSWRVAVVVILVLSFAGWVLLFRLGSLIAGGIGRLVGML
jgi:hypothetical protein